MFSRQPHVLRDVKEGVVLPLYLIFQKSLSTGILPASWKEANVTTLYKKGDGCVPNNYRPVSLTLVVCKMLESIIKDELFRYFNLNNLFTAYQHGFRPGYSCVTQLINVMEDWTYAIECGKSVDVIYLDFSKAFDCVLHARLISKLHGYGIAGLLLKWIDNFLRDRKQRVCVRGSYSSWCNVSSGVPQGSVLGPVLFITYVNDLPEVILWMFADDTKIYRTISSNEDSILLQSDLHSIMRWCSAWLMNLNYDKCMSFGNRTFPTNQYLMSSGEEYISVNQVCEQSDLRVLFTSNFKIGTHIHHIVQKANRLIGLIKSHSNFWIHLCYELYTQVWFVLI